MRFLSILLLALILSITGLAKEPECGELLFPSKGNIDYDQGTYEVWFCLNYSFSNSMLGNRSYAQPMTFLQMVTDEGWPLNSSFAKKKPTDKDEGISYLLRTTQSGRANGVGYTGNIFHFKHPSGKMMRGNLVAVAKPGTDMDWKEGDWHFIAITWKKIDKGYEASMSIDGDKARSKTFQTNPEVDPKKNFDNYIRIGNRNEAWGTINAFRISKKVRSPEEIAKSFKEGLRPDDDTLLFHDGSTVSKLKKIRLKYDKDGKPKMKGGKIKIGSKGAIHGTYQIVNGKFGKAIKLLKE